MWYFSSSWYWLDIELLIERHQSILLNNSRLFFFFRSQQQTLHKKNSRTCQGNAPWAIQWEWNTWKKYAKSIGSLRGCFVWKWWWTIFICEKEKGSHCGKTKKSWYSTGNQQTMLKGKYNRKYKYQNTLTFLNNKLRATQKSKTDIDKIAKGLALSIVYNGINKCILEATKIEIY